MSQPHRLLLKWARYLHVYLTMFGLLVILFFAATGFILNHPDWFDYNEKRKTVVEGNVPTDWLGEEPNKLAIVELLRSKFGACGVMDSFEVHAEDMEVRFKSPSNESEALIHLEDGQKGQTIVTHYSRGILGLITDLHRGEASGYHTGETWSLVIDGVAILLLIVAITGLVLWTSLRSRGRFGLTLTAVGLAVCVVIYCLYVP